MAAASVIEDAAPPGALTCTAGGLLADGVTVAFSLDTTRLFAPLLPRIPTVVLVKTAVTSPAGPPHFKH